MNTSSLNARLVGFLTVTVLAVYCLSAASAQVPVGQQHGVLMQKKLTSTQQVIAGIAREDYKELAKQAQKLTLLSHEAGWNVIQTPEYIRLSDAFRSSTAQLKKAAESQNMDAVGLAYIKLSISCIDCHRHAKEELSKIGQARPDTTVR